MALFLSSLLWQIMKMPTPPPVRYGEMPAAHWICWQEMITVFSRHYLTLILETLEPAVMWKELADYRPSNQESRVFNRRIRDRIVDLAVLL